MRYLAKHKNGKYYLRIRVPAHLISVINRSEILLSLRTTCKNTAKRRCYSLTSTVLNCFEVSKGGNMNWLELKTELEKTFRLMLEQEQVLINQSGPKSEVRLRYLEQISHEFNDLSEIARAINNTDHIQNYMKASEHQKKLNDRLKKEIDRLDFKDLDENAHAEIMNMLSQFYMKTIELHKKAKVYDIYDEGNAAPFAQLVAEQNANNIKLREAFGLFKKEKTQAGNWTDKTEKEALPPLNNLIEVYGNINVNELSKINARDFKDILLKLPPNFVLNRERLFEGKSISEISQLEHKRKITPKTVNKKLTFLRSFYSWCMDNAYCNENVFENIRAITGRRNAKKEKEPFDLCEVQTILTAVMKEKEEWKKWVVLIAAYSGLRLNEICQLYKADIITQEKIPCFKTTYERDDQKLKTNNSERLVPIHKRLIRLGILGFINKNHNERVFSDFKMTANGYGDKAGKWFNRTFLEYLGLKTKKKSFHSLRHSFISQLQKNEVELPIAEEIAGHAKQSITFDTYGGKYNLITLQKAIDQVSYEPLIGEQDG